MRFVQAFLAVMMLAMLSVTAWAQEQDAAPAQDMFWSLWNELDPVMWQDFAATPLSRT